MDLLLDDDQIALRAAISEFLEREYAVSSRPSRMADPEVPAAFLRQGAELGMIGLAVSDSAGGVGLTAVEAMIAHELCGSALVLEPFLVADVAAQLIARHATSEQSARLLPNLLSGAGFIALAHREVGAGAELDRVSTRAAASDGGFVLSGQKTVVLGAAEAEDILVSARFDDSSVGVFVVRPQAAGVAISTYQLLDGRSASDVSLSDVRVAASEHLGAADASSIMSYLIDYLVLALCAEIVGVIGASIALTTEYLRTRHQFGQPLGKFQALQHRMADMLVESEQCRSMLYYGLSMLNAEAAARRAAISLTKAKIGSAGRAIAYQAVQLHGAIGVTQDYPIGQYLKRAVVNDILYGDSHSHFLSQARRMQ